MEIGDKVPVNMPTKAGSQLTCDCKDPKGDPDKTQHHAYKTKNRNGQEETIVECKVCSRFLKY